MLIEGREHRSGQIWQTNGIINKTTVATQWCLFVFY